jgi:hypothetical protein
MGIPEIRSGTFDSVFKSNAIGPEFVEKIQANTVLSSLIGVSAEYIASESGDEASEMFVRGVLGILHVVDSELEARELEEWLN